MDGIGTDSSQYALILDKLRIESQRLKPNSRTEDVQALADRKLPQSSPRTGSTYGARQQEFMMIHKAGFKGYSKLDELLSDLQSEAQENIETPRIFLAANPLNCSEICDEDSPFCEKLPAQEYSEPLDWLTKEIVASAGASILKSAIMSRFQQEDDPCERSDLYLEDSEILNEGEVCYFAASLSLGAASLDMEFVMPEKLNGLLKVSGGAFNISFEEGDAAPAIIFAQDDFNSAYGGILENVEKRNNSIITRTTNGCIAVNY